MASKSYHENVNRILNRLDTSYNMVGGSFIFVWVASFRDRILNCVSTAHFNEVGFLDILKFFHEASILQSRATWGDVNLWTLSDQQKIYTLEPQRHVGTERWGFEVGLQVKNIQNAFRLLEEEEAPYLFFYSPSKVNVAAPFTLYYPQEAGGNLEASDGWKRTICPTNMLPKLPSRPLVTPAKPQPPPAQHANRQRIRGPRQINFDDAPGGFDMGDGNYEQDEEREEFLRNDGDNPLLQLFNVLTRSSPITPTIVRRTDTTLQVVLADLLRNGSEEASVVPVLVSQL